MIATLHKGPYRSADLQRRVHIAGARLFSEIPIARYLAALKITHIATELDTPSAQMI